NGELRSAEQPRSRCPVCGAGLVTVDLMGAGSFALEVELCLTGKPGAAVPTRAKLAHGLS
ncbi:MAG: hypothetical protein WCD06_11055, partial [Candidatus Sulfotelmatobacter sp.]